MRLTDLHLEQALTAGRIDRAADWLYRWDEVAGEYYNYWLSNGALPVIPAGWLSGYTPVNDEVLAPGEGMVIYRRNGSSPILWKAGGE